MAKKQEELNPQETIDTLKARGLSCSKLQQMEKRQFEDAKKFRQVGFNQIAEVEEATAKRIKSLRKKVCLLK